MEAKEAAVFFRRARLAFHRDVKPHIALCEILKGLLGPFGPALLDGVPPPLHDPQNLFGGRPRLVWRQAAMLSQFEPARSASQPILDDVHLRSRGHDSHAEARQVLIPEEHSVLAGRAAERVYGPLGNSLCSHLYLSVSSPVSSR